MTTISTRLFASVFAIVMAGPASAQSCAGFTDVPAASSFCKNVEWIKNRAITQGCTSLTLFCPNDAVTRLQMAAFLNRLGTSVTPALNFQQDVALSGAFGTDSLPTGSAGVLCSTGDIAVTDFPRKALYNAAGSFAPDAAGRFVVYPVFSTDGGINWSRIGGNVWISQEATVAGQNLALPAVGVLDLAVGTSYRFALYLRRLAGSAVNYVDGECSTTLAVFSRDGASSPFDARPAPHPPRE
jgi:hypothetical protein